MRRWPFATFVILLVFGHLLLHVGFGLGAVAPDFIAVAVLLAARRTTATGSALLGVTLGILDDTMGIRRLGARSLALALAAVLGTWSRNFVEGEGLLFVLAYLFAGTWVSEIVLAVLPGATAADALALITWIPLLSLYNAVAGTVAFMAFRAMAGPDA